ncbi:PAS domain-containing protein [Mesorhizobium sp. LHD-90]|uniref:PAS domain-containing protein n=1 Tax=Mesorhizobium sp. LHD-90 TaxID=3071414 RepID=UPI0027E00F5C|nr:PAS domain-containing protein [Mesorhizobium sp. LHD-90]MDQ6437922.1 PAS domain-containing protein [Mesorhizobium sp. LHD-90]
MKREASVNLFQYWNRLRDGRPAPRRTEIEPADIKALLGDTFILENDSRGEAVFRLAGTRLCAIYGRELKGFAFSSLWRENDSRMVMRLVQAVFHEKSVLVISYEGISRGQRSVSMELLLLPLDGGEEHRRALGIISPESKPYWLGADPVSDAGVEAVRIVNPDREPMFLKNRPAVRVASTSSGRDEPQPPSGPVGARRIRHLVVLPGGRME